MDRSGAQFTLVRVRRFRASHRYGRREWSGAENLRVFGAHTEPHEHEYRVEVRVTGTPDPESGFIVPLDALDALLTELLAPLDGKDLNQAIPEVRSGAMQPSSEGLANWLWIRLEGRIPGAAELHEVAVWESDELGAVVRS